MNLQQLAPWNWFKHETPSQDSTVPVRRNFSEHTTANQNNHPMLQLHQEIDRLFDDTFKSLPWFAPSLGDSSSSRSGGIFQNLGFRPQLNIASDDQQYHISLEVPGLSEEHVSLELNNNNTLTIRGEKSHEQESKDKRYYRVERSYGEFQRVLALPEDCDTDKMRATLKNGVLEIFLPKNPLLAADSSTKKIPINNTSH